MSFKGLNIQVLNRYLGSQATEDFNRFLERMPQNVGQTALIAGGIAWMAAAALGLFTMMQTQQLTELRAELEAAENLKPIVPILTMQAVAPDQVKAWVDRAKPIYTGIEINASANQITIQSKETANYNQFREALGHALNGGAGWRVSINGLCVGRECKTNALDASLRVEKVSIDKPVVEAPQAETSGQTPAPSTNEGNQ